MHQVRESYREAGLSIYLHKEIYLKDLRPLCLEIHYKKEEDVLFSVMYRPQNKASFLKVIECRKNVAFAGDLNIRL